MALQVNGKTFELTPDGFLQNPEEWDKCVMEALIEKYESEGNPEVGDFGRLLVKFFRDYYEDKQVHPSLNRLLRMKVDFEGRNFESEKAFRDVLYEMFPRSPIVALGKLAGLPETAIGEEFDAG